MPATKVAAKIRACAAEHWRERKAAVHRYIAARAVLARPYDAFIVALFAISGAIHMALGMRIIVEDYIHSEGTKIGNALWTGEGTTPDMGERIVSLMQLRFEDESRIKPELRGKPIYLIGALDGEKLWRLKPQNLLAGLPLMESQAS